ncbi:cilia- and flagella-associated protein 43 isoform X1 [Pectinophora gossypiella]|uniref:cilia- and flagella-associated protein 43 isoform X1 n=1 Tax=Pectinophora gossypiella TaxID=13191 RepID=UPI00214F3726|nr:cilia- and flagella-associated protein 43 isoform X1 [Pectinophora gossypiella]
MFAFAEKVKHARIFIVTYPSLTIVTQLKDTDINRYKGLCMMEGELVAGFSGYPNYMVTVWSWRTCQRLLALPTGVIRRQQIYMASRSHMLVCQCYGEGLIVWEVAPCFRRCFMMRRAKEEVTGWGLAEPKLIGVCWTNEGLLYAIDATARLYGVTTDGIIMIPTVEWNEDLKGENTPCVCAFGTGILIYGPDQHFRWVKKNEQQKWRVVWKQEVERDDQVVRLVGNATAEVAVGWTRGGRVLRLAPPAPDSDRADVRLVAYKQRNIIKMKLIAPDFKHVATMSDQNDMCIYEVISAKMVLRRILDGKDMSFQASPVEPVLAVVGSVDVNYGLAMLRWDAHEPQLTRAFSTSLTHQQVSRVAFSPSGRELAAVAMAAGHIFIYKVAKDYKLTLVRYSEVGRGLADCFLMKVGEAMRCFGLVHFSDKHLIGERIICINAVSGKDNKFAGKMAGPYARLLPLSIKDSMLAIPYLSRNYHILKLTGDKGVTVSVRMGPIIDSGHDLKQFSGVRGELGLMTYGADGAVVLRQPDAPPTYDFKYVASHRYEPGIKYVVLENTNKYFVHLGKNRTLAVTYCYTKSDAVREELHDEVRHEATPPAALDDATVVIEVFNANENNYLDLQEEKKVREEALDYRKQREEVVHLFEQLKAQLVGLLEENIAERPLHQLSLSEFNLHLENKKERLKQAEKEREEIRLKTEAKIKAQDKVTAWIKKKCWDTMQNPRVKIFAIFSHYQVENYPVLPTQRDLWPELQQKAALRGLEMENDDDVFRPWDETFGKARSGPAKNMPRDSLGSIDVVPTERRASESVMQQHDAGEEAPEGEPYVLSGSSAHKYITVPPYMIPQTLAFSFLQMNFLYDIIKLIVQQMRLWFNKQFDELMAMKKREVGLVAERNSRLRFIIEELNKLSDLRGSFHHLLIQIKDPEWRQEEQPIKLIKVDPEECTIPPYISPSQIVIVPPDPGPKDDFRERALNEMMDGVLEKLWHEEIKKPIPKPQCMLDKEPENWNEDDLRLVFDYEAKVKFRNEERDKYRKMLHAEYAKLSQVLNEGIVKFNMKVKDTWLKKLKVDSVIGQENLNLMRLRRANLDRLESAEKLEDLRALIVRYEGEVEVLQKELAQILEQSGECQSAYDALAHKDRHLDRAFKNNFADFSPIIVDQCYKFFNVEQLDQLSNMPAVLDEGLWTTMCRLRRVKMENEIRMRAVILETAYVDSATNTWNRAVSARRTFLSQSSARMMLHRDKEHAAAVNRQLQLVLPAGQVEIITSGHMEDFEDAALIPREDVEVINRLILKVGALKLRMMRRQMEFRKGILAKEWEHAQMKMKLRHMQQELYTYTRLRIPKELQWFLKKKELGYTDEHDYTRLEKEMAANKMSIERVLQDSAARCEETQMRINKIEALSARLEKLIDVLHLKVSEKRLHEDALEPIRIRRIFKRRMETLVARSHLIRDVQANHTRIVLLQTELELLRLKTFPTLAPFRTFC